MQQFSTTLAGSHSPHDQSNSLSVSHSPPHPPWTASDMRLALLLMRNCSLCCIELYLHPANQPASLALHFKRSGAPFSVRLFTRSSQVSMCGVCFLITVIIRPASVCETPGSCIFTDPVQIQDQGQRPVSPVITCGGNQAALSKVVPRLYLGSRPALML